MANARYMMTFYIMERAMPVRVPVDPGFPNFIYQKQYVPPADMMADPKP